MKCEICHREPIVSLSCMWYGDQDPADDPWKLVGYCTSRSEVYYITLDQIKNQEQSTRWFHHLRDKVWFDAKSSTSFLNKLALLSKSPAEQADDKILEAVENERKRC